SGAGAVHGSGGSAPAGPDPRCRRPGLAAHHAQGMTASDHAAASTALDEVCDSLDAMFSVAASATSIIEHRIAIAGRNVRLRFAGPALVDHVLGPLLHLPSPSGDGPDDLTVCIWDTSS